MSMDVNLKGIKRVLLAVAQSRSLHVVHEAYLWKSCFRNANSNQVIGKCFHMEDEGEFSSILKGAMPAPNYI